MQIAPSNLTLETAIVQSELTPEGLLPIVFERYDSEIDSTPLSYYYATPVTDLGGSFAHPPVGTKVLVAFYGSDPTYAQTFWVIGKLFDRFDHTIKLQDADSSHKLTSNDNSAAIGVNDGIAGMFVNENEISIDNTQARVNIHQNSFEMTKDSIDLSLTNPETQSTQGKLLITKSKVELASIAGLKFHSGTSSTFRINGGNFSVTGMLANESAVGEDRFAPIDMFFVKARKVIINSSKGPFAFMGGSMAIKLASSQATGSGDAPGTGPRVSFDLDVADGDIKATTTVGDIEIRSNELIPGAQKVSIGCGTDLTTIQSKVEMRAMRMLMLQQMTPAMFGSIEITNGEVNTLSALSISMGAGTSIEMNAITTIDLIAAAAMTLEAATITLKAVGTITVESSMLDLSGSQIIDSGPKSVPPTGTGAFCGIPYCIISGAPHSGEKAV